MNKHPEIIVLEGCRSYANWMKYRLEVHGFQAIVGKGIIKISPDGFAPQAYLLEKKRKFVLFDPTKIKIAFVGHDLLQKSLSRGLILNWLKLLGVKCICITVCRPLELDGHYYHPDQERLELISFEDYLRSDLKRELKNHRLLIATTGDELFYNNAN
jgi:hypothetical protein